MNTSASPFQAQTRPELSLKRREHSNSPIPMDFENLTPKERRITGPYGTASLQEAWDKLYKARAILEAEQSHLRDDRIAFQGEIDAVAAREQAVAAHEMRIRQIELQAQLEKADAEDAKADKSTLSKLTRAPFEIARSVFGPKK
jgi:DNA repair exonuclease SbcCD ATPase subunit